MPIKEMMEVEQGSAQLTGEVWEVLKQKATGGKRKEGQGKDFLNDDSNPNGQGCAQTMEGDAIKATGMAEANAGGRRWVTASSTPEPLPGSAAIQPA